MTTTARNPTAPDLRAIPEGLRRLTARQRFELRLARWCSNLSPRTQVFLAGRRPVVVDGQTLEPQIQLALALMERDPTPSVETLPPAQARALIRRQSAVADGPLTPVHAVHDLQVDGAAGPLRARLYSTSGGVAPLLVFFHGGGFTFGDLDTHEGVCRLFCRHAGVHVLAVDYRLGPEHPFPAPIEDGRAAFAWACLHADALNVDPARIAIGGDSAGGSISAVVSQIAAQDGGPAPALQVLLYPATDARRGHRSHDLFAEGFFLTRSMIDWFRENYLADADLEDPRVSPLLGNLSGLAPAIVATAGFDPLRDEGEDYARALQQAGTPVVLRRFPGLIHGFVSMTGVTRVARDATVEVAGMTRALLAGAAAPAAPLA